MYTYELQYGLDSGLAAGMTKGVPKRTPCPDPIKAFTCLEEKTCLEQEI